MPALLRDLAACWPWPLQTDNLSMVCPSLQLGLSVKDMFSFCMAPASASDLRLAAALLHFATKYRCAAVLPGWWWWWWRRLCCAALRSLHGVSELLR